MLAKLEKKDIVAFFSWLQEDYVSNPDGIAPRMKKPLSPKTIRNIHTNLSAFWNWAVDEGFVKENIINATGKPPASTPKIEPLTKDEI